MMLQILAAIGGSARAAAIALGILCLACSRSEAQQPDPARSNQSSLRVNVSLVQLDTAVFDKSSGRAADGLTKEDFMVEEDGRRERIAGVSRDQAPLSVVLLVDQTDTVRPVLATLAVGARQALSHLKEQDEIAVMAYASSTKLMQSFTSDHELVTAAIERASRSTNRSPAFYNEAIYDSAVLLQRTAAPGTRKIIIWLTDNVPNMPDGHVHTEQEAFQQLYSAGGVIMAIVERSGLSEVFALVNKNPIVATIHRHDPAGDVYRYVGRTGGDVIRAGKDEVSTRLAYLIDSLRTRYRVSYYPSIKAPQARFHRVKVSVQQAGRKRNDLLVRTSLGYYR